MALKQAFSTTDGVTDLLYVATHLNIPYNSSFEPDMSAYTAPVDPGSLDSMFGEGSWYEFMSDYLQYYNKATNTWTDGGLVSGDVKGDIATQLEAIRIYEEELKTYNFNYYVEKEIQWRRYIAQKLIDECAS